MCDRQVINTNLEKCVIVNKVKYSVQRLFIKRIPHERSLQCQHFVIAKGKAKPKERLQDKGRCILQFLGNKLQVV